MIILITIVVIIYIYAKNHKMGFCTAAKKMLLKAIAIILSGILVMALVITELVQKLLDKVGDEGKKMASTEK